MGINTGIRQMTIIDRTTFELLTGPLAMPKVHSFGTIEDGTIEVTYKGRTERVEASRWTFNDGTVEYRVRNVFTGRYNQGAKAWPASVTSRDNMELVDFGRDDRSAKFNKANSLFWAI